MRERQAGYMKVMKISVRSTASENRTARSPRSNAMHGLASLALAARGTTGSHALRQVCQRSHFRSRLTGRALGRTPSNL